MVLYDPNHKHDYNVRHFYGENLLIPNLICISVWPAQLHGLVTGHIWTTYWYFRRIGWWKACLGRKRWKPKSPFPNKKQNTDSISAAKTCWTRWASSYSRSVLGPRQPMESTCLGLWDAALPLWMHLSAPAKWILASVGAELSQSCWSVKLGATRWKSCTLRPPANGNIAHTVRGSAGKAFHYVDAWAGHAQLGGKVILGASWNLYKRGVHYSWWNRTRSATSRCRWTWSNCNSQAPTSWKTEPWRILPFASITPQFTTLYSFSQQCKQTLEAKQMSQMCA